MEAEVVQQMVTSGASSLAGLMATAAWQQVSSRVGRLFGRGREDEAADAELELIRAEVVEAGDDRDALADPTAVLRTRLRRLFREDPAAADELFEILAEFDPERFRKQAGTTYVINNTIENGTHSGTTIQAGIIHTMRP
ncbi:hypothetical protein ACFQ6N_13010 [Kitasatospora sp. NPDC056446]|uniref:hypothetical protein n=1 Tax=Kitasatospora sp. NPDC056446 TaxID=3345819 RepID=UPI0036B6AE98